MIPVPKIDFKCKYWKLDLTVAGLVLGTPS